MDTTYGHHPCAGAPPPVFEGGDFSSFSAQLDGSSHPHPHPRNFGKHQWQSEPDGGTKFVTKCLEADHVRARS